MNSKSFRSSFCLAIFSLALSLLGVATASAQGGKGTIRGRVTDPSGDVLQGAQITLEQANASMATDSRGEFFVRDLAPGSYSVTVSYFGFSVMTKTVDVVAGQVA
ncbi:MAG: carboxypeptidase-like regulatory domain-containing protein, partial [Candidatus Acidiferrum sp.]